MPKEQFEVDVGVTETNDATHRPIYTHPSLRASKHEWLLERLVQIRDRRLVAAIQYNSVRIAKAHKIGLKLQEDWEKINERNRLALFRIDELIDKLDASVAKQIEISHKISLVEDE